MHIVITRPVEDSLKIITDLKLSGHMLTHLPVIKVEKLQMKKINFKNYDSVIFTSANAIKFLNIEKFNDNIKCFCVGNFTEGVAKKAGFFNTYSSEGSVASLKELIVRTIESKSEKILYLSSEFISKNLDKDLIQEGYIVERISNYTTLPVREINEKTLSFLRKNPIDAIFIYSSKSAKNLLDLINKYSLLNIVTQCNLMCISEKVSLILKQIKWKKTIIFNPGEEVFFLNKIN